MIKQKIVEYRISKDWDDYHWWYHPWMVVEKSFLWWTWRVGYWYLSGTLSILSFPGYQTMEEAEAQIKASQKVNPIGAVPRPKETHIWVKRSPNTNLHSRNFFLDKNRGEG